MKKKIKKRKQHGILRRIRNRKFLSTEVILIDFGVNEPGIVK